MTSPAIKAELDRLEQVTTLLKGMKVNSPSSESQRKTRTRVWELIERDLSSALSASHALSEALLSLNVICRTLRSRQQEQSSMQDRQLDRTLPGVVTTASPSSGAGRESMPSV